MEWHHCNWCRPLTAAVAAAGRGRFVLDGVARMRERPIQDLVDGLSQLGVRATCTLGTGCPPVEVLADGLPSGTVSTLHNPACSPGRCIRKERLAPSP
jgi:5-enolpyruvylshikimate-3-phosphate synthase